VPRPGHGALTVGKRKMRGKLELFQADRPSRRDEISHDPCKTGVERRIVTKTRQHNTKKTPKKKKKKKKKDTHKEEKKKKKTNKKKKKKHQKKTQKNTKKKKKKKKKKPKENNKKTRFLLCGMTKIRIGRTSGSSTIRNRECYE